MSWVIFFFLPNLIEFVDCSFNFVQLWALSISLTIPKYIKEQPLMYVCVRFVCVCLSVADFQPLRSRQTDIPTDRQTDTCTAPHIFSFLARKR